MTDDKAFRSELELFVDDHFGYRDDFVGLHNHMNYWAGIGNRDVIVGRRGWFYLNIDSDSLEVSDRNLIKWSMIHRLKELWLKERGVEYWFLLAPNKQTVYPEYLPWRYRLSDNVSVSERLTNFVLNNKFSGVVLAEEILNKGKSKWELYSRLGTHWNACGAGIVSRQLMEKMGIERDRGLLGIVADDTVLWKEGGDVDLVTMMNLENVFKQLDPVLSFDFEYREEYLNTWEGIDLTRTTCEKALTDKNVILFGDSFTNSMRPFVCRSFKRTHVFYNVFPDFNEMAFYYKGLGESVNVVVEECVERSFSRLYSLPIIKEADGRDLMQRILDSCVSLGEITRESIFDNNDAQLRFEVKNNGFYQNRVQDPFFILPKKGNLKSLYYLLEIDVTVEEACVFELFFKKNQYDNYAPEDKFKYDLAVGRNQFYEILSHEELQSKVRIDPGEVGLNFKIHRISVSGVNLRLD